MSLLVRSIEAGTGRQVQIDTLTLHLVPAVHIHAVNVRVKNPLGFPQGDAIIVKSVDLGIAPLRRSGTQGPGFPYINTSTFRDSALRSRFPTAAFVSSPTPRGSKVLLEEPQGAHILHRLRKRVADMLVRRCEARGIPLSDLLG